MKQKYFVCKQNLSGTSCQIGEKSPDRSGQLLERKPYRIRIHVATVRQRNLRHRNHDQLRIPEKEFHLRSPYLYRESEIYRLRKDITSEDLLTLCLQKKEAFRSECEVRAVTMSESPVSEGAAGDYYKIDLPTLARKVFVAPRAAGWFVDLVKSVAKSYGLEDRVYRSELADRPTWHK